MKSFFCCLLLCASFLVGGNAQVAGESETGLAVYYADYLHGKRTASGELYDKNAYTASHKTFRTGTILRVTRLDNNKVVRVRVNDRGPYGEGLVVDLSRAAAERIGLLRDGKTRVRIEVVGFSDENPTQQSADSYEDVTAPLIRSYNTRARTRRPYYEGVRDYEVTTQTTPPLTRKKYDYSKFDQPRGGQPKDNTTPSEYGEFTPKGGTAPTAAAAGGFLVQLGSFSNIDNANRQVNNLRRQGLESVYVLAKRDGGKTYNRVVMGPFESKLIAESTLATVRNRFEVTGYVRKN